ncbi:hypothetical protein [Tsukamurella tyrosinosolvens]|uniref:hypothetical protein n=1 Tax=Tsukamurella tyrosinosolvens TaxID=57704 RepID=UPI000DF71B4D|nr:hypothetical protein [Tsukamurella tyrosinosolvens]RDB46680.1 hypothetical protein DVB87_17290 [Tsukamurella tyrosinosolvens]
MATSQPETDDVTAEAVDEPDTGAGGSEASGSEASETTAKITTAKASRPAPKAAKPRPEEKADEAAPGGIVVTPLMLALSAVVVLLAVAATAFGFLWQSAASDRDDARDQLAAVTETQETNARAEDIAKKYAIGAATIDYQNLAGWRTALTAGTTDELANQLREASTQFEQVVVPLQWQSTATPLGTIVASNKDGLITLNVFVNMVTKSTQRPEGIPSTATYTLTIDTKQDWKISDVRGMDAALSGK